MKQRELKFRAWDRLEQEMIYFKKRDYINFAIMSGQGLIPMQFTGLKDKNEVDIYEGDIVETFGGKYADEKWVEVRHISVIEWWQSFSNLGYRLKNSKGKTMMIKPYALTNTMKAKVIGNIHQNKDLLK